MGVVPVAGQPGGPLVRGDERGVGLQCLGEAAVEPGPFPGQQVVADGLADQGVPEAVAVAVGGRGEDAGVDGGAQGLDEIVLAEPGDGGEQPVLDGGAALGDDPDDPLGALRQVLDPDQEQVAQGVGETGAAALVGGDGELLDEEGVAVGAFEDVVDAVRFGFAGEDAGDLPVHLLAAEAAQFDAVDGAQPVEFGEEGAQRVAAVDVVGAVGGEDDQAAGAQGAEQIGEQMAGGGVGPVQVLQDEDDGVLGGDPFQQAGGELEEAGHALLVAAGLAGGGDGELGQQPGQFLLLPVGGGRELVGQFPAQLAQGRGEGGEGQAVGADLHASAEGDDPAPVADGGGELLHEAGLAHPGLAADQQRLRFTGAGPDERVDQGGEFGGAADEDGTDGLGLHAPEHRTGPRGGRSGSPLLAHRHGAPSFSSRTPPWAVRTGDGAAAASVRPPPLGGAHAVRANQDRRRVWLSGSAPRAAVPRRAARRTRTASRTRRSVSARRISSSWRSRCSSISNMMVSPGSGVGIAFCDAFTFVSKAVEPHRESSISSRAVMP